ncbi:unnamed protein product [Paramecium primaurelia]|uniref:EGF-like domain-containing protein n=1 Tax=Paramecium primaurelia TaxID=5886 RepID=A0A8S1QRY9_PARPR|nr:unnamed protein product [Paramecium primaurelia]
MKQTISFSFLIVICFEIQTYLCWSISILPPQYPYRQFEIQQSSIVDGKSECFGVWSKYLPLSNIVQTGEYGILDSSCFHQFRIQEKVEKNLYFLFFECISFEEKIVKKYFQFLDSDNRVTIEQISFDLSSYEGSWFFNGFLASPLEKRVTIYIKEQQTNQIFSKDIPIRFPFKEYIFIQIIGGDFKVEQASKFYLFENKLLSYFPGLIQILSKCSYDRPDQLFQLIQSRDQKPCICKNNQITDLPDVKIQNQDMYEFLSQNTNCQQFLLAGWIKILEINNNSNEFQFLLFKLMGNFQHPQLTQENLSAFQLLYKLSTQINQIILTTYSYTLPVVNIDFSTNPYLKKVQFEVTNDIQLWHYLLVEKSDQFISITIKFYQGYNQEKFSFTLEVVQFQMVQFKLLYGNIFQSKSNYLTLQLTGFQLFNCLDFNNPYINCHPTCKECDGPTKDDCLSCYEDSNRRYISEYKVCICEYGTIDQNNECVNYQTLQLNKIEVQQLEKQCQYGFFEIDDDCYQCPSRITIDMITCLECILNPKSWINTLFCQTSYLVHQNGSVAKNFSYENLQYIFTGDELKYCPNCDLNLKAPYDLIEASLIFKNFCTASQSINDGCYFCQDECERCAILPTNELCLDRTPNVSFGNKTCYAPNYLNFYKKCVSCELENCLYCFDYLASDPTKSTLESLENFSLNDEEIKIGCAQCIEGYIFEFKTSTCINQKPIQQNCLRSYINFDDREICTLSNDFTISLEKINCQDLILHCKQCIKTIQTTIKCLICEDGYIVSSVTGVCSICSILNSKQCQQDNLQEPGKWQFQGFIIQFLPPKTRINYDISRPNEIVIECHQGYRVLDNYCPQYCDESCSVCETEKLSPSSTFYCSKCKRNYYKELIRVSVDRKCIECSSLCQVCQNRSTDEINQINPYFIQDTENSIYTFRCIQKVPFDSKIHIDPTLAIAQYCYQDNCNYKLEILYNDIKCDKIEIINNAEYNYKYLNEIGLKYFTITIKLILDCQFWFKEFIIQNYLKENIFSIRQSELILQGNINPIIILKGIKLVILKHDQIVISNCIFQISTQMEMIMTNRGQSINFYILNTKFYSEQSYPTQISIKADSFYQFNIENFTISDITIGNSIIFDIFYQGLNEDIMINNIKLQDCRIINSTLFYFYNVKSIIFIKNFTIDSCTFENSSIFIFQMDQNSISNVFLDELVISNCLFKNSKLIYSPDTTILNIDNLSIINNQMLSSQFIVFNYNFYCNDIKIIDNYFLQLQLIAQIQSILSIKEISIKNLFVKKNHLTNCSLFITQQKQLFNNIDFLLLNFHFEDNIPSCRNDDILISINCFNLIIQNIFLKNTTNYRFLNLQDIHQIQIDNLMYENQVQEYKVPYQFDCLRICVPQSQLLQIFGFNRIFIKNIQVKSQFSVVGITFFFTLEVVQFQMVQFKLLYGNIFQSKSNYLTLQLTGFQLFNCLDFNNPYINCHPTCKECDGPTKDDCLSCYEDSNRRYISEYKVCICEYGTIDQNNECINYQRLQLNKIDVQQIEKQCQYGFFEINGDCYKCPSIITNTVITCLECILNPKSWINTLLCQTSFLVHQNGSVTKYFNEENLQYVFAGDELTYCPDCDLKLKAPYDLIEASLIFKNFCSASQSINKNCYLCINKCNQCAISSTNQLCLDRTPNVSFANNPCYAPKYINFYKNCVTCKLENCLYCFEYLASDPTKSTLENLEIFSLNDEEIKLGCAQCIEGYVFEFKTSTCINQKPTQQNCLRSYISLDDREICTLSNDFTISLEKINCQDLILHCKQCIKTIQTTIKCLICEDGYIVSSITGVCSICSILNSKQCQQDNLQEPGKWQFQGFIIQFLPPKTRINYDISRPNEIVIECHQGYRVLDNYCPQYCDESCSVCETEKLSPSSTFYCSKCKRNYYKELIRVSVDRKCIECPSLCQVCQNRSTDEINQINPYFIQDTENSIYTFRCIQKVPFDSKIHIDPTLAIAQYCYQDNQ